ncbi:Auxin-responsive protein IAA18 [Raphanus sativus]|uniref:Auxin-responsive protein n=1 Tax=Raphanus sativus TaxID=3726 RepID=A0A6J0KN48_RAPSA|nr:auxin-responsive protein IAA18 isoform X2 [Raphanus sativus]KAJ4882127.1 Auxin-responsive protein IAA18 [Raphanus sativus]
MEGCSRNGEISPKLLHLIPQGRRNWFLADKSSVSNTEEKKLELKLGPPGEDEDEDKSILSLARNHHFSPSITTNKPTSQKRTAPSPVVGWPPVRSFRKNLSNGSSSKLGKDSTSNGVVLKNQKYDNDSGREKTMEPKRRGGLFVKINMYGVPIGRKVDLSAHNSYEQLSLTVDKLFRGLRAAQRESLLSFGEEEKPITGLLDGNGEYSLTYEDNEGDKMLVGDVPWQMFVSSVKRLRVIKTSEISSALTYGR